jgi:hypothetical protein
MRKYRRWLIIPVASGLVALIGLGMHGGHADDPTRLTAQDVITMWKPRLDGMEDFQQLWASPEDSPGVAASTFRVVGPSFEGLWNQYADLCGIGDRYEARQFLTSGGTGARGSYVVTDRAASDPNGGRALSVFLLRTDRYTVTATIQPDPDGKAMRGSIAAVTR